MTTEIPIPALLHCLPQMWSFLGCRPNVSATFTFVAVRSDAQTEEALHRSLTVTKSVATPTTIILSTGAGAIAIWEDEDLTMEGRATEVRNIAVETETSTHTTSITVGKFTQVGCFRFMSFRCGGGSSRV
jgi:hypothetical protein